MRRTLAAVGAAMLIVAVAAGVAVMLLNTPGRPTPVSAAEACNLMVDTPYDALLTGMTPLVVSRAEIRYSGSDWHIAQTTTDHGGVLLDKSETVVKDRTLYSRDSTPGNAAVYREWRVHGTNASRSVSLPCLDTSSFEDGASGSSDEAHFTSERFLSEEEGAMRNEFWADSTGRPTRARRTLFPPEYDGVTNTETIVIHFTYTGYGEPNIIKAPCADAAPDQADNPAYMRDCVRLLALKDTLRGTATLNWDLDTAIASWTGVTSAGTPQRVTKLILPNSSLNGSIPWELHQLLALTHLNLSGNSLAGEIPEDLGRLSNLVELRLTGNSLTGCIPIALKDVATNDLSSLNLLYCRPPAPDGLTAGTIGETSVPLSWTAVSNAGKYRVEYSLPNSGGWIEDDDTLTGTSHTVDGLICESEYAFRVSAFGSGTIYAAEWSAPSATVTATTTDCLSPVFEEDPYGFSVAEDAANETEVGTVSAADPQDDTVTYSITDGNDDGLFAIDTGTGAITVAAALDHETNASYELTVQASDGTNSTTATVEIAVTDVNEPPVFESEAYTFSVAEDAAVWSTVGRMTAIDPDAGDTSAGTVFYYITAGNEAGKFEVGTGTGGADVIVQGALDYETTSSYTLTVEARDGKENGTSSVTVEISVTNVNETPSFDAAEYTFTVPENSATGHSVGTATATDPDDGDALTYSIGGDAFVIDASGAITVGAALDHEGAESYSLTVTVEDESGLSDTAAVSIGIMDVNEAPSFHAAEYAFTVAEDAAVGASVGSVSATDPEEDTLTYSITAGDDDGKFSIDSGGALSVAEALDYESSASYTLTVETTDSGGLSDTAAVSIGITDVNEAPSFDAAEYTFTVAEDAVVGASVGSVPATDPDEDTVTYSITAGDHDGKFSIDSNAAISVAEAPDYETSPRYTLTVEATDAGGLSDTVTVSIEIMDVNEAPSFGADEYTFTVPENSAIAHSVGTAAATDPDEGDALTYSISEGNDEAAFAIGSGTGSITVADALDYETTVAYRLTVEASDGRGGAATATVRISVGDVAEDGPPPPPTSTYAYNVAAGTFRFSWSAVPGADRYRVQYRVGGAEGAWTNLDATTETSQTFSPEGGVECGTTYEFRLQAHGDGETHPAVWGTRTGGITYTTPACSSPTT